jgi:choline kinase
MRAIILAAGRGSRLQQSAGEEAPKCLLSFDGRTLLERHLAILADAGVDEVVLAVGFQPEKIVAELDRLQRRDVEVVLNPRYELGSMLTVHATADALTRGGDVIVMDADVLYDPEIMRTLVRGHDVDRLLIDRDFEAGDEPVKVCVANGVPVEFRKRIAAGLIYDTIGESVGFFRFREKTAARFARIVAEHIAAGRAHLPHEEAIRDLLLEGVDGLDVADVTGLSWIEIDFPEDVRRAAEEVLPQIESNEQRMTSEQR